MIAGAALAERARAWIGTPYIHQAAVRGVGTDCIGLVVGVAGEAELPDAERWRADTRFKGYGPMPLPEKLLAACAEYLNRIAVPSARPGDVLLFRIQGQPAHFGMVSNLLPLRVIHAWSPNARVVEQGIDYRWQRRIFAAFRLRGVE